MYKTRQPTGNDPRYSILKPRVRTTNVIYEKREAVLVEVSVDLKIENK